MEQTNEGHRLFAHATWSLKMLMLSGEREAMRRLRLYTLLSCKNWMFLMKWDGWFSLLPRALHVCAREDLVFKYDTESNYMTASLVNVE